MGSKRSTKLHERKLNIATMLCLFASRFRNWFARPSQSSRPASDAEHSMFFKMSNCQGHDGIIVPGCILGVEGRPQSASDKPDSHRREGDGTARYHKQASECGDAELSGTTYFLQIHNGMVRNFCQHVHKDSSMNGPRWVRPPAAVKQPTEFPNVPD